MNDDFIFMRRQPVDLLRYLPSFLSKSPKFKTVQDTLSREHENYRLKLIEVAKQFFLETSTWGLADWENFLGIVPDENATFDERKSIARIKLRGVDTMTIENTLRLMREFMTSGEPGIEELGNNEIQLILDNGVYNWQALFQALFEYLPAHLIFSMKFQLHDELNLHVGNSEVIIDKQTVENATPTNIDNQLYATPILQEIISEEIFNDSANFHFSGNDLLIANVIEDRIAEEIFAHKEIDDSEWEYEVWLWEHWLKWKKNAVVKKYNENFDEDGELDPEKDEEETFPLNGNFLRLYFKYPDTKRLRYTTLINPKSNLTGREINAVGLQVQANKVMSNSRGQVSNGIVRALYITRTIEKLL